LGVDEDPIVPGPMWPARWQPEAIEAVAPYIGGDVQIEILVDDPRTALSGTLIGGFLFVDADGAVAIIHDRSGRPDVYPWKLLSGPVLEVREVHPRRPRTVIYRHPDWSGPSIPG
jgi:hypothetical protein